MKTTIYSLFFVTALSVAPLCYAVTPQEAQQAISLAITAQSGAVTARSNSYAYLDDVLDPKYDALVADYENYLLTHQPPAPEANPQNYLSNAAAKRGAGMGRMSDGQGAQDEGGSKLSEANTLYAAGSYMMAKMRADEAQSAFYIAYGKYTGAYKDPVSGPDTGYFAEAVLWHLDPGQANLDFWEVQ